MVPADFSQRAQGRVSKLAQGDARSDRLVAVAALSRPCEFGDGPLDDMGWFRASGGLGLQSAWAGCPHQQDRRP